MKQEYIEILLEEMNGKFDLVLEGHQTLQREIRETRVELKEDIELCNFKIDILNTKIDGVAADFKATDQRLSAKIDGVDADLKATDQRLSAKIDGIAVDLKAHRADTEAHHGVYRVKEN
ncbi:hypothetical protein [Pelovirga terrestris]|uniref:Uncharacterized protein n=1 Tax=Pelovirga terrestris TaxID=2771352 RepID=A0A8J6QWE7_9BACT|nr:hypothetical protein [Pelovirga terrestris]MBD1399618.1 hypothetical protein [Pelovirga terrestris]